MNIRGTGAAKYGICSFLEVASSSQFWVFGKSLGDQGLASRHSALGRHPGDGFPAPRPRGPQERLGRPEVRQEHTATMHSPFSRSLSSASVMGTVERCGRHLKDLTGQHVAGPGQRLDPDQFAGPGLSTRARAEPWGPAARAS